MSGWKWGDEGHCYTGSDAKAKAALQGQVIEGDLSKMLFQVEIYKSKLDLGSQSVDEFMSDMSAALASVYSEADYFWIAALYGDRVILSVTQSNEYKYFEHTYDRKDDMSFTFGPAVEVKRVSQFIRA